MTISGQPSAGAPRPYRLSDAERDEAISVLADAFAAGRLDSAEFDRRMSLACQAIFATDLDPLFADLVDSRPNPAKRQPVPFRAVVPPVRRRRGLGPLVPLLLAVMTIAIFIGHLFPILIVLAIVGHIRSRRRAWRPAMVGCAARPGFQRIDGSVR